VVPVQSCTSSSQAHSLLPSHSPPFARGGTEALAPTPDPSRAIKKTGLGFVARETQRLHMRSWISPLLAQSLIARRPRDQRETHLILAIADHYEPRSRGASDATAMARVNRWVDEYPRQLGGFRDADGRPPRHTFFYPFDEYAPDHLDALSTLCRDGFGEVELHLHHDGDTAETLRATLLEAVRVYSERHGLLPRSKITQSHVYGFVHGNWALNNARPDGCWCGVNDEIRVLRETGCYADFTFPSAPSPTQPSTVNQIYYATSNPAHPRGHDRGRPVGEGRAPEGALMLITGPLALDWGRCKWGILPRLENGCLQPSQPPTAARIPLWLRAGIRVPARPDWLFVKLHTHGAPELDADVLLGPPMIEFHRALARRAAEDPTFHVHYVTAREMYNLARAAAAGYTGDVAGARDYELSPCPLTNPTRTATPPAGQPATDTAWPPATL
jgi:hypothetical protein